MTKRTLLVALLPALSMTVWGAIPIGAGVSFTPTSEEAALFTVADNNHDQVTWGAVDEQKTNKQMVFSSNVLQSEYASSTLPFDDWLFLPAIEFDDASVLYELKLDAARGTFSNYYGLDEVFEVKLGASPDAQSMTLPVMAQTHLTIENNKDGKLRPYSELFRVPSAGVYYIGIHAVSSHEKSLGLYIANIEVNKQQATVAAPGAVQSLAATPGVNGALSASVVFHMPTADISGNPLAGDVVIRAVAESSVDSKSTEGAPGQVCVISGLQTVQGINEIVVTTYIGENGGKPASTEVYTGVSIPGPVVNARCMASEDDMTLRFEWEAPVAAADGQGAVSPTGNTYIVYQELMNNVMGIDTYYWDRIGELPQDQTWYEVRIPADGLQRKVKIGVVAKNAAGVNNSIVTPIVGLGGRPYPLPMMEDFTGCSSTEFNYNPITTWEINADYVGQTFTVNDPAIIDAKYNIGHKPVMIFSNHIGTRTRVALPKFSTTGLQAPNAKFIIYMGAVTPDLSLYGQTLGGGWEKISDIEVDRTAEDYRMVSVPLGEAFVDKPWVFLAIDGYFDPADYQIGFVSEYSILNSLDMDLGILGISGASPIIGETSTYTAEIYNPGGSAATITSARWEVAGDKGILAGGNVEVASSIMEPLSMQTLSWEFTPGVAMIGKGEMSLAITVAEDGDLSNNTASLPIVVKTGGKVVVTDLRAEISGGNVVLRWTEPAANHITESFEQEEEYVCLPQTIALFDNYDGDGYQTWNFGEKDPVGGVPQAWTVWGGKSLEQTFGLPYKAASGDRFLMVRCPGEELDIPPVADDWLISPEVNGMSYISFKGRPISNLYGAETLEVMVSSTGNQPEDFTLLETMRLEPTLEPGTYPNGEKLAYLTYTTELPADARHFALHYVSHDVFGIMLDDLRYAPSSYNRGIQGYDIYRNGQKIVGYIPSYGLYTDEEADVSSPLAYQILPVAEGSEVALSNVAVLNGGSSVDGCSDYGMTVKGDRGHIKVHGNVGPVMVFDTLGRIVGASEEASATFTLPRGVYVVRSGHQAAKTTVK